MKCPLTGTNISITAGLPELLQISTAKEEHTSQDVMEIDDSMDRSAAISSTIATTTKTTTATPQTRIFQRQISTAYTRQTYYELIRYIKRKVEVKDRTYLFKTYPQCFFVVGYHKPGQRILDFGLSRRSHQSL